MTVITLLQPGIGELCLIIFLVKTELGWLQDNGVGVVVVCGVVDVVRATVVVGVGVELLVGRDVVVVVLGAVVEVVGAG